MLLSTLWWNCSKLIWCSMPFESKDIAFFFLLFVIRALKIVFEVVAWQWSLSNPFFFVRTAIKDYAFFGEHCSISFLFKSVHSKNFKELTIAARSHKLWAAFFFPQLIFLREWIIAIACLISFSASWANLADLFLELFSYYEDYPPVCNSFYSNITSYELFVFLCVRVREKKINPLDISLSVMTFIYFSPRGK